MDLFWRKGFADTTPQDLATELGIGKGSLYNTFESKRALFDRALQRYVEMRLASVVEQLDAPGPPKQRLGAALRRLAEADVRLSSRGCLAVNTAVELAGVDDDAAAVVGRLFTRIEEAFRAVVEEGQRAGEIDAGRDARQLASMLLTTFIGMSVLAKTRSRRRLRDVAETVLALL